MKLRAAALLLAALMLASSAISCGEAKDAPSAGTTAQAQTAETVPEETTSPLLDDLPDDIDLGGMNIRCFGRVSSSRGDEVSVEEMNGEVINDAVYTRNLNVEQRLNCKITDNLIKGGGDYDAYNELKVTVQAGSDDFDLFVNNSYTSATASADGFFVEISQMEHIDREKPYWSQGYNWSASNGGRQYLLTGSGFLGFYRFMCATVFNKSMFARYDVALPYQTVIDGLWTVDAQIDLAKKFYADLNGDGVKDEGDNYGYVTNAVRDTGINDGFWASLDLRVIGKDEDGWYCSVFDAEKFSIAIDKLLGLIYSDGSGTFGEKLNDTPVGDIFFQGRAAMRNASVGFAESANARNMEDDYGFLPMAKATEEQKEYYSLDQDQFIVYGVPLTVSADRIESLGAFIEAYASESYATVRPAYYEIALTQKYMNDEESVRMLDIVTNSMLVDPAILYLVMSPVNIYFLREIINKGTNTAASDFAKKEKSFIKFIDKVNKAYGKEE